MENLVVFTVLDLDNLLQGFMDLEPGQGGIYSTGQPAAQNLQGKRRKKEI